MIAVRVLFSMRIVVPCSTALTAAVYLHSLERREAISRSPAFNVIAPEYLTVLVGLYHAGPSRHRELHIRPGRRLRILFLFFIQDERVPCFAVASVVRIRRSLRVYSFGREKIVEDQPLGLEIAIRVKNLQLNRELINIYRLARSHLSIVMKPQTLGSAIKDGKIIVSGLLRLGS